MTKQGLDGTISTAPARPRKRPTNPLQAGIDTFLSDCLHLEQASRTSLPKRYTLYLPLLLLPVNFTTHNVEWQRLYAGLDDVRKGQLFQTIADAFSCAGQHVTHIAINAPIEHCQDTEENVLRSPSGLLPVWGDCGPSGLLDGKVGNPGAADFDAAFWVSTVQDHGIRQMWAPKWTMFSRGNLSEKRRILGTVNKGQRSVMAGSAAHEIENMQVLDLYVGIGYFALCYLARGVSRVWGWDLNPWSIEGLRRGCEANGWACVVLRVDDDGECDRSTISDLVSRLRPNVHLRQEDRIRCIAFVGDNRWAAKVMRTIDMECSQQLGAEAEASQTKFQHVNLGMLPTSVASWPNAAALVAPSGELHVHENVQFSDIDQKRSEVESRLTHMLSRQYGQRCARVAHVEHVKTYAPGIIHCVFDVEVLDIE